jgi:hypothetical protein
MEFIYLILLNYDRKSQLKKFLPVWGVGEVLGGRSGGLEAGQGGYGSSLSKNLNGRRADAMAGMDYALYPICSVECNNILALGERQMALLRLCKAFLYGHLDEQIHRK